MELKLDQKNVIADLVRFLELVNEKKYASKAYTALWNEKNVIVDGGINGMPFYHTQISGTPEVCFKVPTGGGKTFIAMLAASGKGVSKIVPTLKPGAGVVTTRAQAQYIVTEYGIAFLRGKDLAQRAKELIRIAEPSAREELERAACERFGMSFLRIK